MPRPSTSPLRLDSDLVIAAKKEGALRKRSAPKQIEFWAELGKAVEHVLDYEDVFAVLQGFKEVKLELKASAAADPAAVFNDLEQRRSRGKLAPQITSAAIYYEASRRHPGFLDRVNAVTGERDTGQFHKGKFKIR